MKQGIHPTYEAVQVVCSCGHTWTTRSTRNQIRTDLCSKCHPFYTGEQRIIDTAGQVDRFMRRAQRASAEATRNRKVQRAADRRSRVVATGNEETTLTLDDEE
jgi:large subunit ribosomal protein L31